LKYTLVGQIHPDKLQGVIRLKFANFTGATVTGATFTSSYWHQTEWTNEANTILIKREKFITTARWGLGSCGIVRKEGSSFPVRALVLIIDNLVLVPTLEFHFDW
jgi:hypothetical protein